MIDVVYSQEFSLTLSKLRAVGLDSKDVPLHSNLRRASVLVALFPNPHSSHAQDPYIVLTRRPLHLNTHPGEVCFPGGKQDLQDMGDDVMTALREAEEEIGLEPSCLEILCRLRTVESLHHLCVTPIVACITNDTVIHRLLMTESTHNGAWNPAEVDAVFCAPLSLFHKPPRQQYPVEWSRETFIMRHYEYHQDCRNSVSQEMASSATAVNEVFAITGLTAHIAHQVAQLVFGSDKMTVARNQISPQVTTVPITTTSLSHSGNIWIRQQSTVAGRHYWSRRFLVLEQRVLHLYDHAAQAMRKTNSANKKNRLILVHNNDDGDGDAAIVTIMPDVTPDKKEFVVSVLQGQVEWHLATATNQERTAWVDIISSSTKR